MTKKNQCSILWNFQWQHHHYRRIQKAPQTPQNVNEGSRRAEAKTKEREKLEISLSWISKLCKTLPLTRGEDLKFFFQWNHNNSQSSLATAEKLSQCDMNEINSGFTSQKKHSLDGEIKLFKLSKSFHCWNTTFTLLLLFWWCKKFASEIWIPNRVSHSCVNKNCETFFMTKDNWRMTSHIARGSLISRCCVVAPTWHVQQRTKYK